MPLAESTLLCWQENTPAEDPPCCEASDGPPWASLCWVHAQSTVPRELPTLGWATAQRSCSTIIREDLLFSLVHWSVCFLLPNLALHHIICVSASSLLASSTLPWVVRCWLLLLVGYVGVTQFGKTVEGTLGSPQGSGNFCAPWQELKPRTQPLQLLGSLPWVTYSRGPHVHLTPNCSSPIRVLRRQFISSALERASLFLITWRCKGF